MNILASSIFLLANLNVTGLIACVTVQVLSPVATYTMYVTATYVCSEVHCITKVTITISWIVKLLVY